MVAMEFNTLKLDYDTDRNCRSDTHHATKIVFRTNRHQKCPKSDDKRAKTFHFPRSGGRCRADPTWLARHNIFCCLMGYL